MILGFPISWLVVELLSVILFFICLNHAVRQENAIQRVFELFGFILAAALFENIGVNVSKTYYYDVRRIMMIGSVPLEILFLEAVTWYTAFNLVRKLNLPKWAQPFAVGLFGTVQDMTIDPAHVFDRYALTGETLIQKLNTNYPGAFGEGVMSGQWNWTNPGYEGGFFGIPMFNISGWFTLMGFFTLFIILGRWLFEKKKSRAVGFAYPFVGAILAVVGIASPLNVFLLYGGFGAHTLTREIIMVCFNLSLAIVLLIVFRKKRQEIDIKEDGFIIFMIPVILHIFDILYAFIMGTTIAYIPVIAVSAVHFVYLYFIFKKNKLVDGQTA